MTRWADDDARVRVGDRIGPELAHDPHELFPEGQVVGDRAIGSVEEDHGLVADAIRGGSLLMFASGCDRERVRAKDLAIGVTAGATHQLADATVADPTRDAAGELIVRITRPRGDDEQALWAPAIGAGIRHYRHP